MNSTLHGLSVGIERVGSMFFLSIKVTGKLTHADYELISPLLDASLSTIKTPKIKALIDCTALEGWEVRAAWDDLQLGLKHNNEFEQIAIYGNKNWLELAAKVGNWFMSGEIKYFDNNAEAMHWLETQE